MLRVRPPPDHAAAALWAALTHPRCDDAVAEAIHRCVHMHLLSVSLAAADLVVCQAGCISHNAYWLVKDHCKRTGKRCICLDRPSAAGFARGLAGLPPAEATLDEASR